MFALGFISFMVTVTLGSIYGQEFSPQTFAQRNFNYVQIPWIHKQIWPLDRQTTTNELCLYLRRNSIIPKTSETEVWHLTYDNFTPSTSRELDSSILAQYLNDYDELGHLTWLEWTEENDTMARLFWPVVAMSARNNEYLIMPSLFRTAKRADNDTELAEALKTVINEELTTRAGSLKGDKATQLEDLRDELLKYLDEYESPPKKPE